ncbi:MAG: helix-turn-helix domain-containing protein [Prevotellaceae bacterium]|nr:helix-turn-helix domain-containing protein [Prevotellaceae bacterium]
MKQQLPYEQIDLAYLVDHLQRYGQLSTDANTCGFFRCETGWATIQVHNGTFTLRQGDIFLYTPSSYLRLLDYSPNVSGVIAKSNLDLVLPYIMKGITPSEIIDLSEHPFFSPNPEEHQRLEHIAALLNGKKEELSALNDENRRNLVLEQIRCITEAYILEILTCYQSHHSKPSTPPSARNLLFQNFILLLFKNYKKQRSAKFYADAQHLSVRYFTALVKEESGRSANQWINQIVITYVRQALAHSNLSIKEIAAEFNFVDQSVFGKYFKQHTGCSPKDYRLQKQKKT